MHNAIQIDDSRGDGKFHQKEDPPLCTDKQACQYRHGITAFTERICVATANVHTAKQKTPPRRTLRK